MKFKHILACIVFLSTLFSIPGFAYYYAKCSGKPELRFVCWTGSYVNGWIKESEKGTFKSIWHGSQRNWCKSSDNVTYDPHKANIIYANMGRFCAINNFGKPVYQ